MDGTKIEFRLVEPLLYDVCFGDVVLGISYPTDDGFYIFRITRETDGHWDAWALRAIADKLDELNKEWKDRIEKYFKDEEKRLR